ncbi:PAR1 protein [Quillaja saponaria]|uniref:PAR1 protein n=1 Tax=Quillaja saponaria TaxID=32244 RepID=A0AAD7M6H7_QUISA|nr:PAR1 protein [Quillaja saponaria]
MATNISLRMMAILAVLVVFLVQGTLGELICEHLSHDTCAFAVSSAGKRCVLEKHVKRSGEEAYTCKTSEIEADKLNDYVETEQCIQACGLERKSLGISSDSLLESAFRQKLCSTQCYKSCPNVIDLFFNLAAGEGVFLPKLCEAQEGNARRGMAELRSSGTVAPGPVQLVKLQATPDRVAPAYAPN